MGASKYLIDPYGRVIKSLRISITQRCNFNCFFCHKEGENFSGVEMTPEEIEMAVKIASELGITRVKLTGGEPLMRTDITDIIKLISPLVEEVSMTTNASMLLNKVCGLKKAGLNRVNISLHSLNSSTFRKITGTNYKTDFEFAVKAALDNDLKPVKLNMVVMKGLNSEEIQKHFEFAKKMGAILQLIEFQALKNGKDYYSSYHYDLFPLEEKLKSLAKKVVKREMHNRRQYHLKQGGIIEVVRPMHNSVFCEHCTRIRITSDGCLKPCLMRNDNLIPFVSLIRDGVSRKKLVNVFKKAVMRREPFWRN